MSTWTASSKRSPLRMTALAWQTRRANERPELAAVEEEEAVVQAREDPNAFIEYCFSDEKGNALRQAQHHREWQQLFTDHDAVALLGHAESGKTQNVGFRIVWELGLNPEKRVFVIGASQGGAKKILGVAKRAIESNERVRKVFPHLRPGSKWTESELLVQRKRLETKDYSVQAYGAASEILGGRADIIVVDDINNLENSRTVDARKKIVDWFDAIVQSRLVADSRIWVTGNAWHREDLIHTVAKRGGFEFRRYSLLDEHWNSNWPAQFPASRIAKIREKTTGLAFARMYQCQPIDDETSRFNEEWFEKAKERGRGLPFAPLRPPKTPAGDDWQVYVGVDLASGKRARKRKGDTTSLFALGFNPRGRQFRVLDIQIGRWQSPEILARMRVLGDRYDPIFGVEDNGQQQLFIDTAARNDGDHIALRVTPFQTDIRKWDEHVGIESLALDFEQGRWIIPCDADTLKPVEAIAEWLQAMLYFSPLEHTPDSVISCWIAVMTARRFHRNPFAVQRRMLR